MKDEIVTPRPGRMRTVTPIDHASAQKHSPPHLGREGEIASGPEEAQARRPAVSSRDVLLTPSDILSRLSMTSAEPAKWMRRIFGKHGVPYVQVCGQVHATEAQYQLLLERITYPPAAAVERTASTTSEVRLRQATGTSTARNSVQEQVTRMLRRT